MAVALVWVVLALTHVAVHGTHELGGREMGHTHARTWIAASSLLALTTLGWSSPADACRKIPPGLREISKEVTVDGVVVLLFGCESTTSCDADDLPSFDTYDLTAQPPELVAGSIVRRVALQDRYQRWALWRPTRPFVAGHAYEIRAADGGRLAFHATTTSSFDPRRLSAALAVEVMERGSGGLVCCPVSAARRSSCGESEACAYPDREQYVSMEVTPYRLTQDLTQWLYTTTFRAGDQTVTVPPSPLMEPFHNSEVVANEYCFSLDAVHAATGETVHVGDGCKQLAVGALTSRPRTEEELADDLAACASPPAGYEVAWAEVIAQNRAQADAGHATGAPGADTAEELDSVSSAGVVRDADGCSVGNSGSARTLFGPLSVLGLASLLARRRSARARPPC